MFANMYATQAILPQIEDGLHVSPAAAGLSITVVVAGVALGGWVHGRLSDRIGRARVMVSSAALLIVPTALLGLSPNLPTLLVLRTAQGLLMPGLLVVAVPYVAERFPGNHHRHIVKCQPTDRDRRGRVVFGSLARGC